MLEEREKLNKDLQSLLVKYQKLEGEKAEWKEQLEEEIKLNKESKLAAEESRAQNNTLRTEYAELKEKYTQIENNYITEIESLKRSEKYLKEKLERSAQELEHAHKERRKLKQEIGVALVKCQESVSWKKSVNLDVHPSKLRLESQLINITPIARIPECEEVTEEKSYAIEEKYKEEQYKNKMLLVEIQNTLKNKSRGKFN